MSMFPAPLDDEADYFTSRQLAKARKVQTETALDVFGYLQKARARADKDRADSQAAGDAYTAALQEELKLLHDGLAMAGLSAAAVELVARKTNHLVVSNERRQLRRFGG